MESIDKLEQADKFPEFARRIRVVCNDRYPRFRQWEEWLDLVEHAPSEGETAFWASMGDHGEAELLGRDVWSILALKVGSGPLAGIIDRVSIEAFSGPLSSLHRATRAWHALLHDSGGQVRDRRNKLWEKVINPSMVSMSEVGNAVRAYENDISLLEQMSRSQIDNGMKYHGLLKVLPTSLNRLARSQHGLKDSYAMLRDYVLNQATQHRLEQPTPMDMGHLGAGASNLEQQSLSERDDTEGHDVLWTGKGSRPKGRGKGRPWNSSPGGAAGANPGAIPQTSSQRLPGERPPGPKCFACQGFGHVATVCPNRLNGGGKGRAPGGGEAYSLTEPEDPAPDDEGVDETAEVYAMFTLLIDVEAEPCEPLLASTLTTTSQPNENVAGKLKLSSFLDSGAARSVCPRSFGAHFGLEPSTGSLKGDVFRTATGARVANEGARTITGRNPDGRKVRTTYAVADTSVALDSVSQICDNGSTVLFTKTGGLITGPSGEKTTVKRVGDTYLREIWVDRPAQEPASGFRRPTRS